MAYKRLGDVLIDAGLITEDQLGHALKQQKETKRRLGDELIAEGVITEAGLIEALQMQLGVEFVDLSAIDLDPELSRVISKNVARQYNVVPVRTSPDEVCLAMSDPLNFMAIEAVKNATRKRVIPMVTTHDSLMRAIMTLYGNEGAARAIEEMKRDARTTGADDASTGSFQTSTLGDDADAQSAPTVRLVNSIIERAATERASDIHLEPREIDLHVRMRIDGVLRTILTVPKELQASVISRLKIMGGMNTSERRVPQDGRANIRLKKQDIDLRINTLPTIHGETVVIRLLDKSEALFDPAGIGLEGDNLEKYQRLIGSNNGMVLIVGPTGSGKSSTMYTMIRQLNTDSVNLVTLEDPVEYNIDGVNQVQINEKTGMTFASGLRAILRQDPDIVAVGEIRDGETAEIAMRAAITGHLVLSTVHTYDAASDELACVLVRDVGGSVVHARGIVNVGAGKKRFRLRNAQGVRFYGILEELLVCQAVQLLKAQILFAYGARRMHAGAQVQRKQNDDEHQQRYARQREFSQVILDEQVDLLVLVDQRVVIDDGVQLGTVEAAQRFV